MAKDLRIVTVSLWEIIKIHSLTFVFGVWIMCKMSAKWVWDPKSFFTLQQRDTPPACLVDSSLGQHKYVKLKVSTNMSVLAIWLSLCGLLTLCCVKCRKNLPKSAKLAALISKI
jgi:hypothetical protein